MRTGKQHRIKNYIFSGFWDSHFTEASRDEIMHVRCASHPTVRVEPRYSASFQLACSACLVPPKHITKFFILTIFFLKEMDIL